MQIVFAGDNLHGMSKSIFCAKVYLLCKVRAKIINLASAKLPRVWYSKEHHFKFSSSWLRVTLVSLLELQVEERCIYELWRSRTACAIIVWPGHTFFGISFLVSMILQQTCWWDIGPHVSLEFHGSGTIFYPAGTWRLYNVASISMQRRDVASTLRRRCINVMCSLGSSSPNS